MLADRNRALTGHTAAVLAVCGTPDDRYAVTGDEDGTVRVWDVVTGRCGAGSRQALPSPAPFSLPVSRGIRTPSGPRRTPAGNRGAGWIWPGRRSSR
ncbi:hypothetical protein [Streptomyces sp. enrichment culture]|uniref:hypothetical protein n=1 Tax=Streptomyces sp. enrichment culture TaxID=1795815 RepID=UPI003F543649